MIKYSWTSVTRTLKGLRFEVALGFDDNRVMTISTMEVERKSNLKRNKENLSYGTLNWESSTV